MAFCAALLTMKNCGVCARCCRTCSTRKSASLRSDRPRLVERLAASSSPTHEYALFYGGENALPGSLEKTEKEKQRYPFVDESGRYAWRNLLRTGTNDRRSDRPKLYYPIFVGNDDAIRIPRMEWDEQSGEYRVKEEPRPDETVVWPVKEQNGLLVEKNWERGWERVSRESREPGEYRVQRNGKKPRGQEISIHFMQRMDVSSVPKTWWGDGKYASSNHGAKVLKDLFVNNPFDFPKSVPLVEENLVAAFPVFNGIDLTCHHVIGTEFAPHLFNGLH